MPATDFDFVIGRWAVANRKRVDMLDPPVEGRFESGHGDFRADDTVSGQRVRVRFEWDDLGATSARRQQSSPTTVT